MARYRSLIAALFAAASLACPANAQSLQRLTVTQLTLSASTTTPQVEVPFDLIVTAHVNERIKRLENLDLPILAELELLGDESATVAGRDGSTYTERIRVVAHHSGKITIAPVTLDAVDARDGKAKRYSSNDLTLDVSAATLAGPGSHLDVLGALVAVVRWAIAIALVAFVVAIIFVRRRRWEPAYQAPAPPAASPQRLEPPPPPRERLRAAYALLRSSPTRGNVVHVRTVAREMVGANDAETLDDVLARIPAHDIRMRSLLRSLERAAFTHDSDLTSALDDVLRRLEELT